MESDGYGYDPDPPTGMETFCPFCNHYAVLIEVAGHSQCSRCTQVVDTCCG